MNTSRFIYILILSIILIGCDKSKDVKKYFQNGKIKSEYTSIDNKIEGKFKTYFQSGHLEYESNIMHGQRNGIEIAYYENGKVKMKGSCKDDKEFGFYYFYDNNGKTDSIIEYIWLDTNNPTQSYIEPNKYNSQVVVNRHLIYNKNGKINLNKSLYFYVEMFKDTISIQDTLKSEINFALESNGKKNDFKIYFYLDDSEKMVIVPQTYKGQQTVYYNKIPNKKGDGYLTGMIEESLENGKFKYWFFRKEYHVN